MYNKKKKKTLIKINVTRTLFAAFKFIKFNQENVENKHLIFNIINFTIGIK